MDDIACTAGNIVSHGGKVVYRLKSQVRFTLPVVIDGEGEILSTLPEDAGSAADPAARIEAAGYGAARAAANLQGRTASAAPAAHSRRRNGPRRASGRKIRRAPFPR